MVGDNLSLCVVLQTFKEVLDKIVFVDLAESCFVLA